MDSGDIQDKEREMITGDIRDEGREMITGYIRDEGREMITGDIRDEGREMDTGDIRDEGREMDTGDISDSHKEMVCEKAAVAHQWEVVIQLLCDGVSPAEWIISELFENMTPQLLSCFSPGKVHSSVRGYLLQSAVRFGQGDFLLQILHHETVPDKQLMDTIMSAVHLRQRDVLLQLFRSHSRSRRVFRQFFPSEPQSDDEEIHWVFNCLDEGGEKDLALDVATCAKASLVADFFRSNIADISLKKPKFRHALSHLYAFFSKEFDGVATELCARSHYDRRHIFWFALGQRDFHLAAEVCGPGIRRKDLKLALPWILNECCEELVSQFIRNAEPLFGRECCVQLATQCALERLSVHRRDSDLDLFLALYQMNKDTTFCQRLFKSAVRQFIRNGDDRLFVNFFRVYFHGADLEGNRQVKDDCQFAFLKALKARKYNCIKEICQKPPENCQPVLGFFLDIVFGARALDALRFLQNVCRLDSDNRTRNVEIFKLVLNQLFASEQWQKYVPAVNVWAPNGDNRCLWVFRPPFLFFEIEEHARVVMSRKAKWCQKESYYNLAFVLAFSLQDWNMLEEMLTRQHYWPPFDLRRCIVKIVGLGQFSIAVALLRHYRLGAFPSLSLRISEESRRKLADTFVDSGLMAWAVHFTIPDWNRIHSLLQTGHHPDALKYAWKEARDHGKWDFLENLVDRCTGPDRVMNHILTEYDLTDLIWGYVEKLMDRCTDPHTLSSLLKQAANHGKLEIVRSVISRVSVKAFVQDCFPRWSCVLTEVLIQMAVRKSSNILQVVCMLVKAGISTVNGSGVSHRCTSPRANILLVRLPLATMKMAADANRLMIQSGAVSFKRLDKWRHDRFLQQRMNTENDESWKQCYTDIVEAAATPCSLQHLARLAVSDAIGCHPGRPARIDSLPITERLKGLINFKDVTDQYGGCD